MLSFKEYFNILTEDPDLINTELDGNRVILKFDSILAAPFGFINPNATFLYKNKQTPFFVDTDIKSELIIGERKETHYSILKNLIRKLKKGFITSKDSFTGKYLKIDLSNEKQKEKIITDPRYTYPLNSHKIFDPCGRVWVNVQIKNEPHTIISFWGHDIPITMNHINDILDSVNVSEKERDNVYIENPLNEKMLLTIQDFNNIIHTINGKKKSTSCKELAHLAAGFGGAFKDKTGFGSRKERERADRAGFNTVAQYKDVRYPYKEQYILFPNKE